MIDKIKLSNQQQKTIEAFNPTDTDLDIAVIYQRVFGDAGVMNSREMQQALAPVFARINGKIKEARIEPGVARRTYRYETQIVD
jgi:hypothetical protein